MATTAQQMQNLILIEVGEGTPDTTGPVASVISTLWAMFSDKALLPHGPRLQYLYCLVKALDLKIGFIMDGAYMPVGVVQSKALDDKVLGYQRQKKDALDAIAQLEAEAGGLRTPAVGQLTRTAPIQPSDSPYTTLRPDPNDRVFRGDPLFSRRFWP